MSHYIPSPDQYPLVYYVELFYKIFIPVTLGGMALLVVMDVSRTSLNRWRKRNKRATEQALEETQAAEAIGPQVVEAPATEDPIVDTPAAGEPTVEAPAADSPSDDAPPVDAPDEDAAAAESPSTDAAETPPSSSTPPPDAEASNG
jgi:hypothetical protein